MEVAAAGDGLVRIRDSKDPDGPRIIISAGCWRRSLPCLTAVPDAGTGCVAAAAEGSWTLLQHGRPPGGAVLRFTPGEWDAFQRGAADGEFDLTTDGRLRPAAPARRLPELSAAGRRLADAVRPRRLTGGAERAG